jgi:alpha-galactosidase
MFMWHVEEPVEKAALQILNILFSVPQLSVLLDKVPPDHVKMIRFWTQYWKENRHVLLDSEFMPYNPGAVYPLLQSKTEEKTIAVLYNDIVVKIEPESRSRWDVVNAKSSEAVVLDVAAPIGKVTVSVYDCLGEQIYQNKNHLKRGVFKFVVPPSGLLSITE